MCRHLESSLDEDEDRQPTRVAPYLIYRLIN